METPTKEMRAVSSKALKGSPRLVVTENSLRKGITPSCAIACSSRGAPEHTDKLYNNLHHHDVMMAMMVSLIAMMMMMM